MFVGDDQLRVEFLPLAKPVAFGAGALRCVEGEEARGDFGDGKAADRAGEFLAEHDAVGGQAGAFHGADGRRLILPPRNNAIGEIHKGKAIGKFQRRLETFGQTLLDAVLHHDAVDDDFDVMLVFLVERGGFFDCVKFAVNTHAGVAGALPFGEFLAVFALAALHHGREQEGAGALWQGHDAVDHLADGLGGDRQARGGGIGDADPRPEQAHIVVNLGHGGDGRARVAARRLLLDGDGRRQALDMLDIGFLHHLQKLARIGGQRFHIAALPLGIDGVEGQRRLARPRQAGNDDQLVPGQVDIDALEVMLARTAHLDMGE